jgi:beta-mannosidase
MPSFPSFYTMGSILGPLATPGDHHPQSEVVAHHIKAHSFEKRLYPYILENFRISTGKMEEIIYLSQLVQSEALSCAYRGWRHKWGKRHCGGALVWQLNDVWPAISWSIMSFPGNPKPAFYAIARELKPFTLIAWRHTNDPKPNSKVEALCANKTSKAAKSASMHSTPHIYPPKKSTVEIFISSVSSLPQTGLRIVVKYITLATSASTIAFSATDVAIEPNETLSLFSADVPEDQPTVVHSVLYDAHGEVLSTGTDWPQPLKWVQMPEPGLSVEWDVEEVVVNSESCVKGLVFEEREGEMWADNGIDVVPGMACRIRVEGLMRKQGEERQMWWYGRW